MFKSYLGIIFLAASACAATDRITQPINPTRTVPLARHLHPRATAETDRGPVDAGVRIEGATLFLKPGPGIDAYLASQQLSGSPAYRHWLNPEQFGERFGLSANDLGKITAWLESSGLHIDRVARGRHWISFSGSAGQFGRAFHTEFHRFVTGGVSHFANATPPQIPEALAGVVSGFLGFNDFPRIVRPMVPIPMANLGSGTHAIAPDDFATIYNLKPVYAGGVDGTGQKIAIIGGSALDPTDTRLFRKTFGLSASDPQTVVVGRDPGVIGSAYLEAQLDIQWTSAIARGAQVVYVYASDPFLAAAYAVDNNVAPVVSMSFGDCEAYDNLTMRAVAQQGNAQGITLLAATGDFGSVMCDATSPTPQASKGVAVSAPASIPEVTAVGGTQFNDAGGRFWNLSQTATLGSAVSYIPEVVWNEFGTFGALNSATGGGPSAVFSKPWWQSAPGVPDDHARDLPDVSLAAAAEHDGYLIVYQGSLLVVGGTSAATPAFAGVVALLNQTLTANGVLAQPGLGNINPSLYRLARAAPSAFHDVTGGDNLLPCEQGSPNCNNGSIGFAAAPGFDLATGLGSIDAQSLIAAWDTGSASTTTVVADPASAGLTDTVTLTATVKGKPGAAPTGTVTFLVSGGVDGVAGSAALTASGDNATAQLSMPATQVLGGTVAALYSGDATYQGSTGTVTVGVNAPASGSLVVAYVTPNPSPEVAGLRYWPIQIVLSEKAGVGTTLTNFSFNGLPQSLSLFSSSSIPAKGTVVARLTAVNQAVGDITLHFAGRDADGTTWTRDVTQHLAGPAGTLPTPGMTLVSSLASVSMNPQADPACQWSHQVVVHETGGFQVQLTSISPASAGSIQALFGTTRLAPFGSLNANICVAGSTGAGTRTYQVNGTADTGVTVSASVTVTYANAAASPATFAAAPASVTISDANPSDTVNLTFTGGSPQWTVSVLPPKPDWLTLSATSGTGSGALTIRGSAAGLSKGAWNATVVVQATGALPQAILVPVTFVVGASSITTIQGVANGASFATNFAPGMVLSVFGAQLASATQAASTLPLPLSMAGVSATVNGISAPLYFVSPGQINLQIPYETTLGPAVVAVNNNGEVAVFPLTIAVAAPGIFAAGDGSVAPNPTGSAGQTLLAFITGDGDLAPTLATGATPSSGVSVSRLPRPRLPVSLTVGGMNATIVFAGVPPGLSGVTQINFTVPAGVAAGVQPVVVTVGDVVSPAAKLTIQ